MILIALVSGLYVGLSTASSVTFGQTAIGNNSAWQSAGFMIGSRFIASTGTPISISVYIGQSGSSSNTVKCAIYAESNKQLIAVTEEKTFPGGFNGWLTLNFHSAPSLLSGSSYSLVVWFKGSQSSIRYTTGNAAQTWYAYHSYTANFPNGPYSGLSAYGQENNVYSIYCTLDSGATSTFTPKPTQTPTSTPTQTPTPTTAFTFGQTSVGTNTAWQPANEIVGTRFNTQNSGTLNFINVYITNFASTPNTAKCAIYSETNKAFLTSSQELTINSKTSGWFAFPTTTAQSIVAGQRYSLVIWFKNSGCLLSYSSGTSSQSWYVQKPYGNFEPIYTTYGQENTVYSLYATLSSGTYSPNSNPTPSTVPVLTPASTPIVAGSSSNLAPILGTWGDYNVLGDVCYGNPSIYPQITHADFAVTRYGHPSIRIDGPGIPANGAREVENRWISVKPGDHVVFSCWIKTNPSPIGEGGSIAFDCYGPYDRIIEVHPRTIQSEIWKGGAYPTGWSGMSGSVISVPYGSDWTKLTIDVTIPYTIFQQSDWQQPLPHGPQQIVGILPILGASWNQGESASVWFADAELYINP